MSDYRRIKTVGTGGTAAQRSGTGGSNAQILLFNWPGFLVYSETARFIAPQSGTLTLIVGSLRVVGGGAQAQVRKNGSAVYTIFVGGFSPTQHVMSTAFAAGDSFTAVTTIISGNAMDLSVQAHLLFDASIA